MTDSLNPKEHRGRAKRQLQLCPPIAKAIMAAALEHGARKYGAWNWRTEGHVYMMTYIGAIQRHLDAFQDGEDLDPESGVSHLGHIMACCAVLLDAGKAGRLIDDRPE